MILERKYLYKSFVQGTYLGLIPKVVSDFGYTQEINTAGTQITIEVDKSLDTANESVEPIENELGEALTTETGATITTERSTELMGLKDSGAIIANDNDIEVWEISDDNPNGVLVFSGYISRWHASLSDTDKIEITVISYGKDTDDYVVGNSLFTLQTSQDTSDFSGILGNSSQSLRDTDKYGQTITGLSYGLSRIDLWVGVGTNAGGGIYPASANTILKFYQGDPNSFDGATLLQTVNKTLTNGLPTFEWASFLFSEEVQLSSGLEYFYTIEADDYIEIGGTSANPFAGGDLFQRFNYGSTAVLPGYDLQFRLYSGSLLTDAEFTSYDPSTMVTDSIDIYRSQGGIVNYTGSSIDLTGLSLDYMFRMATLLEIVQKARDLAGSGFYWFVDPASQILYFKQTPTTATHTFKLHEHIESFEADISTEDIRNVVYFSGGPTAGVNLLKKYTDDASLAENRRGMERLSDNRVTVEATAQAISQNLMDENSEEVILGQITVLATKYPIATIFPGDTVAIAGLGNFLDTEVLQTSRLERYSTYVTLTLGKLPIRTNTFIDQLKRDLDKQQTLDNPNTPS